LETHTDQSIGTTDHESKQKGESVDGVFGSSWSRLLRESKGLRNKLTKEIPLDLKKMLLETDDDDVDVFYKEHNDRDMHQGSLKKGRILEQNNGLRRNNLRRQRLLKKDEDSPDFTTSIRRDRRERVLKKNDDEEDFTTSIRRDRVLKKNDDEEDFTTSIRRNRRERLLKKDEDSPDFTTSIRRDRRARLLNKDDEEDFTTSIRRNRILNDNLDLTGTKPFRQRNLGPTRNLRILEGTTKNFPKSDRNDPMGKTFLFRRVVL
jgi:hypothetical protein